MATNNLIIENARIAFRNFSGKEGKYNPAGKRNFCVFLNPDDAAKLKNDGWNVKLLRPRDEDEDPQAYLQVAVSFDVIPPKAYLVSEGNKTLLDEHDVDILDWSELSNVDLIIRPYNWTVNGKSGVKAYLKKGYFTLETDKFSEKYKDVPDSAKSAMTSNNIDDDEVPFK